jgi:1D-myo-inositol 3-kinase
MAAPLPPPRLLVAGSVTIDRIESATRTATQLGGVVTYAGLTFALHGLDVGAVFHIAAEHNWIAERLQSYGVTAFARASNCTTRFVNTLCGEERASQTMPCSSHSIESDELAQRLRDVVHLHLGPLHPTDFADSVFVLQQIKTLTVSLDLQGYVRRVEAGVVVPHVAPCLPAALQAANFVKASEDEIALVCSSLHLSERDLVDRFAIDALVVTAGRGGGHLFDRTGSRVDFLACTPARVADPTGAGDVFFAAFLAARVHFGSELYPACVAASQIAAKHVAGDYLPKGALNAL